MTVNQRKTKSRANEKARKEAERPLLKPARMRNDLTCAQALLALPFRESLHF